MILRDEDLDTGKSYYAYNIVDLNNENLEESTDGNVNERSEEEAILLICSKNRIDTSNLHRI